MSPFMTGFSEEIVKVAMGARQDFTYIDRLKPKTTSMGVQSAVKTTPDVKQLTKAPPLANKAPPPPPVTTIV